MSTAAGILALLALLPAATGAPPVERAGASGEVILALCSGGTIALPAGDGERPAEGTAPCCAKGCHASDRKRKLDRGQ